MRTVFFVTFLACISTSALAQETNPQARPVLHTTVDLSDRWFITDWAIGNVRAKTPSNFNLFPGLGLRSEKWWFEAMVQRQWNPIGKNQWMLDFRSAGALNKRATLYLEWAPFLSQAGQYEFVQLNVRVYKQLSIGAESEDVQRPGTDSWNIGPRLSFPVTSIGEYKLSLAVAYQIHYHEPDIPRLYIVLDRRFKRKS